jgi:hypothetical protein
MMEQEQIHMQNRVMFEAKQDMQNMVHDSGMRVVSFGNDKFVIFDGEVKVIEGSIRKAEPRFERWSRKIMNPNSFAIEFGSVIGRAKAFEDRVMIIWDKKVFIGVVNSSRQWRMEKHMSEASMNRSAEINKEAMNKFKNEQVPQHPNIGQVMGRGFADEKISIEIGMPVKEIDIRMMGKEAVVGKEIMKIIGNSSVEVHEMGKMIANESVPVEDEEHNKVSIPMIRVVGNKQEIIDIINQIYD